MSRLRISTWSPNGTHDGRGAFRRPSTMSRASTTLMITSSVTWCCRRSPAGAVLGPRFRPGGPHQRRRVRRAGRRSRPGVHSSAASRTWPRTEQRGWAALPITSSGTPGRRDVRGRPRADRRAPATFRGGRWPGRAGRHPARPVRRSTTRIPAGSRAPGFPAEAAGGSEFGPPGNASLVTGRAPGGPTGNPAHWVDDTS
jgi:hypothetical protein